MSTASSNVRILPVQENLQIQPQSGHTGALVSGVNLRKPLSREQIATVREALYKWGVVYFRDQNLDHAQHIAFGRQFGDVTPGHPYEGNLAPSGFPEIHTVSPQAYAKRYGEHYRKQEGSNGPGWHADVTPLINPPAHSILRAEVVPDYGGDTQFTNVAAAYRALSRPLRDLIDGLRAEHRFGANLNAERSDEKIGEWVRSKPLASVHPVVRLHPDTGEKVIYVNPSFTRHIVGLTPRESRYILDLLFDHLANPIFTDRFRWRPGSIAFWDNRKVLHLAPRDFEHLDTPRVLHRITLVGDVPIGPNGERSASLEGTPFLAA